MDKQNTLKKKNSLTSRKGSLNGKRELDRVMILRHGQSQFNAAMKNLGEILKAEKNMSLIDAPISEEGHKQCLKASKEALTLLPNVKIVVVSPLRRALETAYHTFKAHPNIGNIRFILNPDVRESMNSICDIPNPILDTINEFKQKFPNLDTSLMDLESENRNLWFLTNIDESRQNKYFDAINNQPNLPYQNIVLKIKNGKKMKEQMANK